MVGPPALAFTENELKCQKMSSPAFFRRFMKGRVFFRQTLLRPKQDITFGSKTTHMSGVKHVSI